MSSVAAPRKPLAELAEREFLEDLVRLPTISARGTRSRAPRAIARARTPALILFFASQHRTGKQSARVVAIRTENSKTRVGKTRFCFSSVETDAAIAKPSLRAVVPRVANDFRTADRVAGRSIMQSSVAEISRVRKTRFDVR
jgi:hypothetical protein